MFDYEKFPYGPYDESTDRFEREPKGWSPLAVLAVVAAHAVVALGCLWLINQALGLGA